MKNRITKAVVAVCAAIALALGGAASANAFPWGDTSGTETYVPTPSFIDDCGTSKDRVLTGNKGALNWWVYKNADGTVTATVSPKAGYWIETDENQTVWDFPAYTNTCIWVTPTAPTRTGPGTWDISFPRVTGVQWNAWQNSDGTVTVKALPKIGYGFPSGTTAKWVL